MNITRSDNNTILFIVNSYEDKLDEDLTIAAS